MGLIMKGHRIKRRRGALQVLGELPVRLIIEGSIVWEIPKITHFYTTSTIISVPDNVHSFSLCGSAAGGGGSATLGGSSGQIYSNVAFPVIPGELINIVIGQGGAVDTAGEDSSFGTLTLTGGATGDYAGVGTERVTCGGRYYDGAGGTGGQASTHGNGGAAGEAAIKGAGGGSNAAGGNGIFQVSYFFEDQ